LKKYWLVTLLALFTCASGPVAAQQEEPCKLPASEQPAARQLHQLFDEEWEYGLRENPLQASSMGDRRFNDRWGDQSLAAIERRHQHDRETLQKLAKIDRAQLTPRDQVNYDMFKRELEMDIEGHQY
jgi:uncharacterized protein (DUF885 family)